MVSHFHQHRSPFFLFIKFFFLKTTLLLTLFNRFKLDDVLPFHTLFAPRAHATGLPAIFKPTHVLFQRCINLWNYSVPLRQTQPCADNGELCKRHKYLLPLRGIRDDFSVSRTPLAIKGAENATLCGRHVVGTPRCDSRCTGRHKRVARPQTRWGVGEDDMEQVNKRWKMMPLGGKKCISHLIFKNLNYF